MAVWIDDTLSEQDRWLDLSFRARACLIDLWLYCKRARNDGMVRIERLHRASDAYTVEVLAELVEHRWVHRDGAGCGTDTCPRGAEGYAVMHDYTEHQESAQDLSERIGKSRQKKRDQAEWRASHEPIRDENGRIVKWVEKSA